MIPALPGLYVNLGAPVERPWSLATPVFIGSFAVGSELQDFIVSPDGTKLYFMSETNQRLNQYDFGTPFMITTLVNNGNLRNFGHNRPHGCAFKTDGTAFYYINYNGGSYSGALGTAKVYEFIMSTLWSVITGVWSPTVEGTAATHSQIPRFKPDGNKMYASGVLNSIPIGLRTLKQHSLNNWDIDSISDDSISISMGNNVGQGFTMRNNGSSLMQSKNILTGEGVQLYSMTDWDITGLTKIETFDPRPTMTQILGVHVTDDGKYMYLFENNTTGKIYQYSLF